MKDFDLNKIGKQMPYQAPNKDFFVDFTDELITKIEQQKPKRFSLKSYFAPIVSIAAIAAIVLTFTFGLHEEAQMGSEYIISDNLDESVDSFFANLSDEELTKLTTEIAYHDDFYYALSNI